MKQRMTKMCKPFYPEGARTHLLVSVGFVTMWLYRLDKLCVGRKAKPEEGPLTKTLDTSNQEKRGLSW